CQPSEGDHSTLLALWLVDFQEGHARPLRSTIAAEGYVSTTTLSGIQLDEDRLRDLSISDKQLREVKGLLALGPPIWIRNLAEQGQEDELQQKVDEYYTKKLQQDGSFSKDIDNFITEVTPLLRTNTPPHRPKSPQALKEAMLSHHPQYFARHRL